VAWIRTIAPREAQGKLAELYRAAVARAGRVYEIVRLMSLSPVTLESSIGLYRTILFAREGLSRAQREMLAVVTSRANDCHY
jgi:alkylhydroperoxidase family enzyme